MGCNLSQLQEEHQMKSRSLDWADGSDICSAFTVAPDNLTKYSPCDKLWRLKPKWRLKAQSRGYGCPYGGGENRDVWTSVEQSGRIANSAGPTMWPEVDRPKVDSKRPSQSRRLGGEEKSYPTKVEADAICRFDKRRSARPVGLNRCRFQKPCIESSFNEFDQDVLLSTWPLLSAHKVEHGCAIFSLAFKICPALRDSFRFG